MHLTFESFALSHCPDITRLIHNIFFWANSADPDETAPRGIQPVWSGSLLSAWENLGSLDTQWVHSKDSDQMDWSESSLGAPVILLVLSCAGSIFNSYPHSDALFFKIALVICQCKAASYKDIGGYDDKSQNLLLQIFEPRHEKTCFCHIMRTTKVQISLRIHIVWSAPLFSLHG